MTRATIDAANEFGRTVLTGAVALMAVASVAIFLAAPWLAGVVGEGFDPATQDLYVQLVRINCVAQVLFAASIALGEILVAHRRFLFYALAPIFYTSGIIAFTVMFAGPTAIVATAWGAVAGAAAHLGDPRDRHDADDVPHQAGVRGPDRGIPRVPAPDGPADVLGRRRAADDHLLHAAGGRPRRRRRLGAQLRPRLPGPAGQPHRRVVLAGRVPGPVGSLRRRRRAGVPSRPRPQPRDHRHPDHARRRWPSSSCPARSSRSSSAAAKFTAEDVATTSLVVAAFALSIPFDALAYPLSRGLYATHDTLRQVIASFAGLGVVIVASQALEPSGRDPRDPVRLRRRDAREGRACSSTFLSSRVRRIGRARPGGAQSPAP